MAKVSVVIPVYNVEKYLNSCIDSVLNQTLKDIEIICINDGSTDGSLDILHSYEIRDDRIKVINLAYNNGPSYTRNRGLEQASGGFIYFLDSDDMITADSLDRLYSTANSDNLDVICFEASLIFENDFLKEKFRNYQSTRTGNYDGIHTGQELFVRFIENNEWVVSVPRMFIRRDLLTGNSIKFYEGILHEDELFTFLLFMKADKIKYVNNQFFLRRFRESSIMTKSVSGKNIEGFFICYHEIYTFWMNACYDSRVNEAIDHHLMKMVKAIRLRYNTLKETEPESILFKDNFFLQHLFKIIAGTKERLYTRIDEEKSAIIKQYDKAIIYGAGATAREALEILDHMGIGLIGFAVTNLKDNPEYIMGAKVYVIEDLMEYKEDTLILVAVTARYRQPIISKLKELGFKQFISV